MGNAERKLVQRRLRRKQENGLLALQVSLQLPRLSPGALLRQKAAVDEKDIRIGTARSWGAGLVNQCSNLLGSMT